MGKRGPKRLPDSVIEKRGSRRKYDRKKEKENLSKEKKAAIRLSPPPAVQILSNEEIWAGIPNYDPRRDAKGYRFDRELAEKVILFFHNELRHVKGELACRPFILEPWEQAYIGNLFGWVSEETGLRRYRASLLMVARKNGKTPLAAGIILYLLFEDGEPGAEIYGAASEYKQASFVFYHAWGMRNMSPTLRTSSKVFKGQSKSIEVGEPGDNTYGIYRVISSDAFAAHGFNTHGGVVDELHAQPNRDLVDALETSIGARRQPLLVYITTSDFQRPDSICNEKEEYGLKVCRGIINDPTFLPCIYKADEKADWKDPETWKQANPNLGVSVSLEYLKQACQKAQEIPAYENTFKRLHLNIRTEQDVRWLSMDVWNECGADYDERDLLGEKCYGGLDLSTTTDLSAFVLYFPERNASLCYAWAPKERARQRADRDRVPYLEWAKQGHIELTPGDVIDYDLIRKRINELREKFDIQTCANDRWNSTQLTMQLDGDGLLMTPMGQGFASMTAPTKELEKLILERAFRHNRNPVMTWCASNVSVEQDAAGNLKPSKKKSTERIDCITALINAIAGFLVQPETTSIYETRGLLML